jgi:hypothetical protein
MPSLLRSEWLDYPLSLEQFQQLVHGPNLLKRREAKIGLIYSS